MQDQQAKNPHIIGLTGSFGSGCTYVAREILAKMGYEFSSLSDVLKELYWEQTSKKPDQAKRRELQDFGDQVRSTRGADYFARRVWERIQSSSSTRPSETWVVDSIRNPAEVKLLRDRSHAFFLFGLCADKDVRWARVRDRYHGDSSAFEEDDRNDTGEDSTQYGQRVADCFSEADVVLANNTNIAKVGNADFLQLQGKITAYVGLAAHPLTRKQPIRKEEALMAMAYAASQQSSCLKRKVGAIIVDGTGAVISSGFNEVPMHEKPCVEEHLDCYREVRRDELLSSLAEEVPEIKGREEGLRQSLRRKLRMLDDCRALHAEENAILNLARTGRSVPLGECTLYTTTYPCRLCANKIVTVGMKRMVYLEPYPDQNAKLVLTRAGVKDEFFEGVTFKAYFRIYGEEKR